MLGILSEAVINEVLENGVIGRLGYTDGDRMFIIPISYVFYNNKYIIAHSREGRKIEILRQNPDVCLEVDAINNLSNWKSVLLWGKYEEITGQPDRHYALDLLIRKINRQKIREVHLSSGQPETDESMVLPDREKAIVYRIKIESKSGRFERSEE